VDWQGFSQPGYGLFSSIAVIGYPKASRQVSRISKQISDFIMFLLTEGVLKDPKSVHIVGFGLGAQIGEMLYELSLILDAKQLNIINTMICEFQLG
jgi:hypothetical protein